MVNLNRSLTMSLCGFFACNGFLVLTAFKSCDFNWMVERHPVPDADKNGYVNYSEKIAEFDFGEGLTVPFVIVFSSKPNRESQFFGFGWNAPLFESRITQTAEETFEMSGPDGVIRFFHRKTPSSLTLEGPGAWSATLRGQSTYVIGPCGWEFRFLAGRISSIKTPSGRVLMYSYSGSNAVELSAMGSRVSMTNRLPSQRSTVVEFRNRQILLSLRDIPARMTYSGFVPRLTLASVADFENKRTDFSVEEIAPDVGTLNVSGALEKIYNWDLKSGRILSSNQGEYLIKLDPSGNPFPEVAFRDNDGRYFYWFADVRNGSETVVEGDGVTRHLRRETSGNAKGKLSSVEETAGGVKIVTFSAAYDEYARPIRILRDIGFRGDSERAMSRQTTTYIAYHGASTRRASVTVKDSTGQITKKSDYSTSGALVASHSTLAHLLPAGQVAISNSGIFATWDLTPDGEMKAHNHLHTKQSRP